jgi:hypothetical protein
MGGRVEVFSQQPRLIVESRTPHVAIDLLQADQVGILRLDHVDDPIEPILPIAPADPFVHVVAQEAHQMLCWQAV